MESIDVFAPLASLQWVDRNTIHANDYNPNKVSEENLKLLVQSILTNGWTLPIVVRPDGTIIDGFHRWTVSGREPLLSLLGGKVPVVVQNDLVDMDNRIIRTEEWMCAQTMLENGCTMQEMIDNQTKGEAKVVKFYNPGHENDHLYTVAHKWSEDTGDFFGDVPAMCRLLSKRGLRAVDMLLGADVYDAVLNMEKVQRLLDKNSGIIVGKIEQELSAYDGVTYGGTLNFRGYKLNLISVDETYVDTANAEQRYFPKTDALITAPGCGHLMYGAITQINYGDTIQSTIAARRVPKFSIDQENDVRKMSLKTRPLAAPKNYIPWIRAKNVVG